MRHFSSRNALRTRHSAGRWSASIGGRSDDALRFTATPGPLLAVVGMCGGAGTSTLAYLTAVVAAARSSAPVLACDTGGPAAGLGLYAGVQSARTLADIAERLAGGERLAAGCLFTIGEAGLRLIAAHPQFTVQGEQDGVRRLLNDARAAHALTVVDCGTLARSADQAALSAATHVAWTLPATRTGIQRAERVLERITPLSRPEILVARADAAQDRPPVAELARLADARRAPLVMMPRVCTPSDGAGQADLTLQAIGWLLRR